jgi:hypothetical protein
MDHVGSCLTLLRDCGLLSCLRLGSGPYVVLDPRIERLCGGVCAGRVEYFYTWRHWEVSWFCAMYACMGVYSTCAIKGLPWYPWWVVMSSP